jgi:hypothetical protein
MRNRVKNLLYSILLIILTFLLPVNFGYAADAGASTVRFAIIGDYGNEAAGVADVADLVYSWDTDFIITVGDNRYGSRSYDQTVGQFYCPYLRDAGSGAYCQGGSSITNDFYPSLGNHDYLDSGGLNEYLNYFTLPGIDDISSWTSGTERYYDFIRGPVHFFVLDSQASLESVFEETRQMNWLKSELAISTTPWQVVYFHHSPYSSGPDGSTILMRWPFASWGAEAVISGHNHAYERINANGIVYFVNGLGGASAYSFENPVGGSQVRYNNDYGAMLIDADNTAMIFQFINTSGDVIDTYTISESSPPGIIDVWVESSFDDVEQSLTGETAGTMYMNSSDVELGSDSQYWGNQAVGLRFQNIAIPQGSYITKAYLEFVVDETGSSTTVVEIRAQDINDAPAFSTDKFDVTDRNTTTSIVSWDISEWKAVDDIHQSPDLSAIVQEVVDRNGWKDNNSMVFIITGTGSRTAESWDGESASAALLHIEYSSSMPTNIPPAASFMVNTSELIASFTDMSSDSDGTIVNWMWNFGDGNTSSTQSPAHTYAADGTYAVSLTVTDNDGDFSTASQSVTVAGPPLVTMHVGEMNGTSAQSRRSWNATATITVHDSYEKAVSGATVSGSWSGGVKGNRSCVTNASGECSVIKNNIKLKNSSVMFTVKKITHLSYTYDPDSNIISSITINK